MGTKNALKMMWSPLRNAFEMNFATSYSPLLGDEIRKRTSISIVLLEMFTFSQIICSYGLLWTASMHVTIPWTFLPVECTSYSSNDWSS